MSTRSWCEGVRTPGAVLSTLLTLLALACCGSPPPGPEREAGTVSRDRLLFPMEAGRTWSFERRGTAGSVTVVAEGGETAKAARLRVAGKDGATYALVAWRGPELRLTQPERREVILLRLPARPGMAWTAAPGVRATMLEDATVRVPAGTFRCAVVRLVGGDGVRETYWVAPGVGFVRVLREGPAGREEAVLAGYAPGP